MSTGTVQREDNKNLSSSCWHGDLHQIFRNIRFEKEPKKWGFNRLQHAAAEQNILIICLPNYLLYTIRLGLWDNTDKWKEGKPQEKEVIFLITINVLSVSVMSFSSGSIRQLICEMDIRIWHEHIFTFFLFFWTKNGYIKRHQNNF